MSLGLGRIYENLTEKDINFFLGQVEQVHLNDEDKPSGLSGNVSSQTIRVRPLDSSLPTTSRAIPAFPLIRGISDSVTRGDLVLITLIYEEYFYIGPINSFNKPNFGSNPTYSIKRKNLGDGDYDLDLPNGYGKGYPIDGDVDKLAKKRSFVLDGYTDDLHHTSKHTDLVFEGRHRNAIRIGSRDRFPILNISNGNELGVESANYGSLISLIENGSIRQHHGRFYLSTDASFNSSEINPRYQICIGNNEKPFTEPNSIDLENLDLAVYNYSQEIRGQVDKSEFHQILITSNNIILDARTNNGDLTLSSGRNINIGAAQNFTLNNQGKSVINSGNIYLGQQARDKKEPLVLGDELRALLLDIMTILQDSRALVQGVPIPLVDDNSAPMFQRIQNLITELQPRTEGDNEFTNDGPKFMSHHHYIEINNREQNNEG
jgi:hypothetical protein